MHLCPVWPISGLFRVGPLGIVSTEWKTTSPAPPTWLAPGDRREEDPGILVSTSLAAAPLCSSSSPFFPKVAAFAKARVAKDAGTTGLIKKQLGTQI